MPDPLEIRYENELTYIRQMGMEFARERPKIADRLLLDRESGASEDPHVERLIEAFAFLTARIRLKLDDEFPELTESYLETLYPHYLAPIPSMSIVEFEVDPQRGNLPEGHTIERGAKLYAREIEGVSCEFRTTMPLTLWPIEVANVRYQTAPFGREISVPPKAAQSRAVLRIELAAPAGSSFAELNIENLRFFLSGDHALTNRLYELLYNHATQVMVQAGTSPTGPRPIVQPPSVIRPVGFGPDEGLLPYGHRSFLGYRLLTEFFCFPQKFLFTEIGGLGDLRTGGYTDRAEILIFFNRSIPNLEAQIRAETMRLGCVPIINLFDKLADPIRLTRTTTEYHVIPDVRHHHAMEVYSIDAVTSTNMDTQATVDYRPIYSYKHGDTSQTSEAYWYQSRRPSLRKNDDGSEVFLSLVDLEFNPTLPPAEVLMLEVTCSNRDLPGVVRATGGEDWGFQLQGQAPYRRITPLVGPTATHRLPPEQTRWRLISHLTLNHLSITEGEDGAEALRELLRIYDYAATRVTQQYIDGIVSVSTRRAVAPITDATAQGFCRGLEVTVEFDDDKFAGGGPFLFAAVLERFLGMYASLNSATRLVARSKQREGNWKRWPFRSGNKTLA